MLASFCLGLYRLIPFPEAGGNVGEPRIHHTRASLAWVCPPKILTGGTDPGCAGGGAGIRCKRDGRGPRFVVMSGGADILGAFVVLGGGYGAGPELAGRVEHGAAQVLEQPRAVAGQGQAAPAAGGAVQDGPDQGEAGGLAGQPADDLGAAAGLAEGPLDKVRMPDPVVVLSGEPQVGGQLCRSNTRLGGLPALSPARWAQWWLACWMLLKIVYLLTCRVLSLVVLVFRCDRAKDAELLVLRHENAVLRRNAGRYGTSRTTGCGSPRWHGSCRAGAGPGSSP